MTIKELNTALDYVDHTREKRTQMAKLVIDNPNIIKPLLDIIGLENNPLSSRAAWILEFAIRQKSNLIYPFLDSFSTLISNVSLEGSVRPMAKICELLVQSFYSKTQNNSKNHITRKHLERITTCCFDWLIGDYKVAPKAYAITTLFFLGKEFKWIHPELKIILEQNYVKGSAAYKARARMTLKKMK